jgi:hypothetical protein
MNRGVIMKRLIGLLILMTLMAMTTNAQLTTFSTGFTTAYRVDNETIRNLNGIYNYDGNEYGWDVATGSYGFNSSYYIGYDDYRADGSGITDDNKTCPPETSPVPEPTTLILIGLGLAGFGIKKKLSR